MPRWILLSLIFSLSCLGCQAVDHDMEMVSTAGLPTPEPSPVFEGDLTNQFPVVSSSQEPTSQESVAQSPVQRALTIEPDHGAQVWVNTKSGVYHYPGARFYGNTQEGVYMSESEAQSSGYHAAANGQ